jgi:hypothetical protein
VKTFISVFFGILCLSPSTLTAQGTALSGGIGLPLSQPDPERFASSYVPPFLLGTEGTGRAWQALAIERSWRPAVFGAVEWLPGPHAGVLVRGVFRRTPLSGANTPYRVSVDYIARQPPDYVARQYHNERSTAWPDTTGQLDRWDLDAEITLATGPSSGARAHIDAGVALVGLSGWVGPVGLTTFQLGGHSVLFSNEYQLTMDLARTWSATAVASGGVTIPAGPRVGIDISARALLPRTIDVALHVKEVGGDTALASLSAADAERTLSPGPLRVKLGTFDLLASIRIRL